MHGLTGAGDQDGQRPTRGPEYSQYAILSLEWSSEDDRLASGLTQLPGRWLVERTCKLLVLSPFLGGVEWQIEIGGDCGCKPDKLAPSGPVTLARLWCVCSGEMKKTGLATSGLDWPAVLAERTGLLHILLNFPLPFPPSSPRTGQSCF